MRVVFKVEAPSGEPFVGLFLGVQGLRPQGPKQCAVSVEGPLDLPCGSLPSKDRVLLCFHEVECRSWLLR